jgi:hypothetical protein
MDDYVAVLYEWNDSINRNLALIHRYFGSHSREVFDFQIGAQMRELGVLRRDVVDTQGLKTRRTSGLSGAV